MSTYENERGTVKLPTGEFSRIKKDLNSLVKERNEEMFEKATSIYKQIMIEKKGKRNFDFQTRISQILHPENSSRFYSRTRPEFNYSECWDIQNSLCLRGEDNKVKLQKPKKKDFAVKNKDHFETAELTVSLDSKNKAVIWNVSENNHAVESAHESWLGRTVIRLLNGVKYTNRTGGEFYGNDEYNRENDGFGGGGAYVTKSFGKYATAAYREKQLKDQAKTLRLQAKWLTQKASRRSF